MKLNTFKEIRETAVKINISEEVFLTSSGQRRKLNPQNWINFRDGFNTKNGIVSILYKGELYVIPNFPGVTDILIKNMVYPNVLMQVPLAGSSSPMSSSSMWEALLNEYRISAML